MIIINQELQTNVCLCLLDMQNVLNPLKRW